MLEAFERHLKQHNIAKQFESAKTKEEKIEVCKKFLESEGITVRSNLDAEKQYKESLKNYPLGGSGGGGSFNYDLSTISIDANTLGSLVVAGGGGSSTLTIQPPPIAMPFYVRANYRLPEHAQDTLTPDQIEFHVIHELEVQLEQGLRKFISDRKLLRTDTDYSTMDKLYSIKIGLVE